MQEINLEPRNINIKNGSTPKLWQLIYRQSLKANDSIHWRYYN